MRVLFVNENIGGHASVHAHLRTALRAHPDVHAEFLDVPAPGWARRLAGARVPGLARLDLDLQPARAQLALSTWVRHHVATRLEDVDAVHVYTANAGLRIVSELTAVPSVVSVDATNVTNATRLPYRRATRFTPATVWVSRRLEQRVYDAATLVVASTGWVAGSLRSDYGLTTDRLRVLPFGIVAPAFGPGPAPGTATREGSDTRLPQVVFVGRQLDRKGGLRLLDLHQRYLADECELVLVTTEPVCGGRNVRVVDDVAPGSERLWEVLRRAAVFAFPSVIDQAPNVVIEAMAAGLPVVGLRVAAMGEMVPPDGGRLLSVGDDVALVKTLRTLVHDAELRGRMGAAARRQYLLRYDAAVTTGRLLEVLREARERKTSGRVVPR